MSQRQEQRRQQAIDTYLAEDPIEDICRQLACAKSWLYKWRDRYEAHNPAWAQEQSTRPKSHPIQTPEHVERAVVSLSLTLRHNGTGGDVTALMQALTQQGIEPVPSRRTLYRKQNLQSSRQNSRPSKQIDRSFLRLGSKPFRLKLSRGCSYFTPPWQGGEITRITRRKLSIPCMDRLSHMATVVNA